MFVEHIRDAFINALVHRDYSRLGAVHVRLDDDGLTLSSPGGFVEGITLQNLLVAAPRSRNPLLADIMKRIGLAERTGRGIDRIYEGMLRYGRPSPDYTMSDAFSVTVFLSKSDADTEFLEMILHHEEQTGTTMPIDSLIILSHLRQERRLTTANISADTQKSEQATRTALEKLAEAGLWSKRTELAGGVLTPSAQRCIVVSAKKRHTLGRPGSSPSSRSIWCLRILTNMDPSNERKWLSSVG